MKLLRVRQNFARDFYAVNRGRGPSTDVEEDDVMPFQKEKETCCQCHGYRETRKKNVKSNFLSPSIQEWRAEKEDGETSRMLMVRLRARHRSGGLRTTRRCTLRLLSPRIRRLVTLLSPPLLSREQQARAAAGLAERTAAAAAAAKNCHWSHRQFEGP